jgi:hypothetical protein
LTLVPFIRNVEVMRRDTARTVALLTLALTLLVCFQLGEALTHSHGGFDPCAPCRLLTLFSSAALPSLILLAAAAVSIFYALREVARLEEPCLGTAPGRAPPLS